MDETHVNDGDAINGRVTLFNKANVNENWSCGFGDLQNEAGDSTGTTEADILTYLSTTLKGYGSEASAVVRTPTLTRASSGGTILPGARSISFLNSGADDVPTVLGAVLKQGESVSFNAGGEGDTLAATVYTVASGELLIAEIR